MKKKYISLFLVILLGMIFNISNIKAYEETNDVIGQTKFVDKDGNINTVDVYDGTTNEEYNPYARTVSTANMVNFNCSKAKTTTNFTDYYTGQEGYLSKSNAADAAFLGYENGKVKFMISGIVGLVDPQYVEVLSQGTYYASNYEVNSSGDLYHYISNNVNATGNQGNKNYIGTGPSYLTKNKEYYSYDGHYFYDNYNTMITDYKNNVRNNAVNPNNPYYSYFQYLPMRSQTTYTGSQISNYLNNKAGSTSKLYNTGDIFIKYQNKYGVNALMAASFAALESGWGKSNIALNKNNLFGLNATDNNPGGNADTFSTVDDCIMNFTSSWMSKRYLNPTYTSLFRGGYFGDKGSGIFGKYSSDPYEGEKCASIAKNMDASISSKDNDYYTLGIKDIYLTTHTALNVRSSSNTNSSVLYTTIKNPAYSFIIKDASAINDFYKIQSEVASSDGTYSFDNTGYVSNQYVTLLIQEPLNIDVDDVEWMEPIDNLELLKDLKVFSVNGPHATSAFAGYYYGYTIWNDAILDKRVKSLMNDVSKEINTTILSVYPITKEQLDSLTVFPVAKGEMEDTIYRIAKDPIRKLSNNDRLVGIAQVAEENHLAIDALSEAIALGYCYDNPEDKEALEIQKCIKNKGIEFAINSISGIKLDSKLYKKVLKAYHKFIS